MKKPTKEQLAWRIAIKKYPDIDDNPTARHENEAAREPFVKGYLMGLRYRIKKSGK